MTKKIMFSDKYGLTQAVLEGRKTQTRRIITYPKTFHGKDVCGYYVCRRATDRAITEVCMYDDNESFIDEGQILPKYKVGEVVAVAQSYKYVDSYYSAAYQRQHSIHGMTVDALDCVPNEDIKKWFKNRNDFKDKASWNNKMFVKSELMPHQIRITNVRVEKLQDIQEDDCLKEGVVVNEPKIKGDINMYYPCEYLRSCAKEVGWGRVFHTPREAFAELINKVSKKDVWSLNPYVFVYDFELVK